jgi:hypothetical protein
MPPAAIPCWEFWMFRRRTLFVLGAGSSAEVGFPAGKALAGTIGVKMDIRFERMSNPIGEGDHDLFSQITHQHPDRDEYQQAAWLIRDGICFAQSIDDFLDQHRTNRYVNHYGKAAVVRAILESERASDLSFRLDAPREEQFNPSKFANTWFLKFTYMLARGIPRENVREIFDRVSFVVFNYDRCLEFYLLNALQKLYAISDGEAAEILDDLDIVHPYGSPGTLREVPFGAGRANYATLADSIKTYTEQIGVADVIEDVSVKVQTAESIVFLGFAYHDQNIAILKPAEAMPASKHLFGTAFGMSDSDVDVTSHQLDAWFTGRDARAYRSTMIRLENKLKCAGLFDYYAKSLTGE